MISIAEPHFHVMTLYPGLAEIIHEIEFDDLGKAVETFIGLIESFNNVTLPTSFVLDQCDFYLDLQGAVIENGRIPVVLSRCLDKCTINKNWRN